MDRSVLLALILVVALPAASIGAAPVPADRVAVLPVPDGARSGFANQSLDVSIALALQRDAAAATLDRYAFDARYRRAPPEARRDLLFERLLRIRERIAALRRDDLALRRAYANGSLSPAVALRRSARIDARAGTLRADLERIATQADQLPGVTFRSRIQTLSARLTGLSGPVRDRALAAARGTAPPTRIYLAATREGLVLAMLTDGRYVRETYRGDQFTPRVVGSLQLDGAFDRAARLYPTAFNGSLRTGVNGLGAGVYRVTFALRDGSITTHIDGDTKGAFYEIRSRQVGSLAGPEAAVETANDTRLVVNRTYAGGPLRVAVTTLDGEPVDATVTVGRARLRTGPDGVVWTVAPDSQYFRVRARGPAGSVTTPVRLLPFPAVNLSASS